MAGGVHGGGVRGGEGGTCGRGARVAGGHVWQGVCVVVCVHDRGGMHGKGACVAWGRACRGVCGGVCVPRMPLMDRQTGVKTLPCPKLRLRAVKIYTLFTTSFQ